MKKLNELKLHHVADSLVFFYTSFIRPKKCNNYIFIELIYFYFNRFSEEDKNIIRKYLSVEYIVKYKLEKWYEQ